MDTILYDALIETRRSCPIEIIVDFLAFPADISSFSSRKRSTTFFAEWRWIPSDLLQTGLAKVSLIFRVEFNLTDLAT